jgi:DnaJ-class molecular chaperone
MGMDVYGKNATNEAGEYFRRNVWGWRPLWDYCLEQHGEIAGKVKYGHSNDGDGLNDKNSKRLAGLIYDDLANGSAEAYIQARQARLAELERPECEYCNGSGVREDEVGRNAGMPTTELSDELQILLGRTHGTCNGCRGEGKTDAWETHYYLDLDDLKEFAVFLENCGGFKIC